MIYEPFNWKSIGLYWHVNSCILYCCDFFIFSFSIYFPMFFDALLSILAHKFPPKWTQNPKNYSVNLNEKSHQNPENPTMNITVTLVNWRREGWVTVVLDCFWVWFQGLGHRSWRSNFLVWVWFNLLVLPFLNAWFYVWFFYILVIVVMLLGSKY